MTIKDKFRHLDLFSGIGGFALAASWVWGEDHEIVSFCEIEKYPQQILKKHWPDVPCHDNVATLGKFNNIDLITGGFPCQPFSSAAHGKNNARDWWPEMLLSVQTNKPRFIIAENVQRKPILKAKQDLELLGYKCDARNIEAFDAGADHQRNRWWLCAYPNLCSELPGTIDAKTSELQKFCEGVWGPENYARTIRVPDGLPNRMDRLKGLGNAIVPQVVVPIMQAIKSIEETP